MYYRVIAIAALVSTSALSFSQRTINVSSPVKNDFLGKTNPVNFAIEHARFQVTVKVKASRVGSTDVVTSEKKFTPDTNDRINDNVPLNFSDGTPQGTWKIEVEPVEFDNNGVRQTYTPSKFVINPVVVDVKNPTFYTINPLDSNYVRGTGPNQIVKINANLNEPNIDLWKVQINSGDIPNNSGSTSIIDVDWSTKGIQKDGQQTITFDVKDKAKNPATKTVNVTLDRIAPRTTVLTPTASTNLPPGANINVVVRIDDQFPDAVDETGIDIVAKTLANKFIARVSRRGISNSGNSLTYAGNLRWRNSLPRQFKLAVSAVDRAGNRAVVQEVVVTIAGR
ncbi:MAG: hypothetical protein JNM34_08140 [Chthonomonadaceae bacterium]|nr:hypothetical protein [Chthonomonadaceae bacterium]